MTPLRQRIAAFMQGESTETFAALALDLWAEQVRTNPDYRAICGDIVPTRVDRIPVAPVRLFRSLPLTSFPPSDATVVFRTSGTTGGRGVVRMRDTTLYDLGARAHAQAVVGPIPTRGASLVARLPDSSLAHMCWDFSPDLVPFFDRDRGVDGAGLRAHLASLTARGLPAFVPGTAFAFAELVEQLSEPIPLAPGSVVMVTGGFKGRRAKVSAAALGDALRARFPTARIVGEYGMSELSSQLWSEELGGAFVPPPWLRVLAVDPDTGEPAPTGLLRFVDLASVDTVLAIETGDLGEVLPNGSVVLHGRHAGAPLRGCSLTVEEALRPPTPVVHTQAPPRPYDPSPDPAHDEVRIARVLEALQSLRRTDPAPLGQGLSPESAAEGWSAALAALTAQGLREALATPGRRPPDVTIVVAWGVFTSPVEWVALYAAAGCAVHLKAPARDPALCEALAQAFTGAGLPVTSSTNRELGSPSAVVAFGSDDSVSQVVAATPGARHARFGHRFSVALCEPNPVFAQGIGWVHGWYDTRGCMAPAAVFCLGPVDALVDALVAVLPGVDLGLPPGQPDRGLGPERRRRRALAAATGRALAVGSWEIHVVHADHFTPSALPRVITLIEIDGPEQLEAVLEPWRPWLSSLGADDVTRPALVPERWQRVYGWFPRVTPMGTLQRPAFPRKHDGVDMLGVILEPDHA